MENQTAPEPQYQELTPQPVKNNKLLLIFLSFISLASISLALFFGYKYYQADEVATPLPTSDSIVVLEEQVPIPTLDPTEEWSTYANTVHGVSFKYPTTWALKEGAGSKEGNQIFNKKVELSKDQATIEVYFNMDGIGGQPREYDGMKYILDGHDLYKFNTIEEYSGKKKVGISNSLSTLGFFMIDDVTYMIHLSYPIETNKIEESSLLNEFDEILSTFKFASKKTSSWKTYSNSSLGFKIQYPENVVIDKEFDDEHNRATSFKGGDLSFGVMIRTNPGSINFDEYYYMDNAIKEKATLAGRTANIYEMPNGYCDGPSCSEPSITAVIEKNSELFHLSFMGDAKFSELEKEIMSTFELID